MTEPAANSSGFFHFAPANSSSGVAQLAQHTAIDPDLSTLDMSQLQDILGQSSGAAQLAQHTATDPDLSTLDKSQLLDILGQPLLQNLSRSTEAWKKGVDQTIRPATEIRMPTVRALLQSLPPGHVKVWEVSEAAFIFLNLCGNLFAISYFLL